MEPDIAAYADELHECLCPRFPGARFRLAAPRAPYPSLPTFQSEVHAVDVATCNLALELLNPFDEFCGLDDYRCPRCFQVHIRESVETALRVIRSDTRYSVEYDSSTRYWTFCYKGEWHDFSDLKGLHDLTVLLANPGTEYSPAELCTAARLRDASRPASGDSIDDDVGGSQNRTAGDEVLDDEAIKSLRGEIERSRANKDLDSAERIEAYLRRNSNHRGLSRRWGMTTKKERDAVRKRLREALMIVEGSMPNLGMHLRASLSIGPTCLYRPEAQPVWLFSRK